MTNFHGHTKRRIYFEGWYFKLQREDKVLSIIPGMVIDRQGERSAFIQVITKDTAVFLDYPYSEFRAAYRRFAIKIGENTFTDKGMEIHIDRPEMHLHGKVAFGEMLPPEYSVMGPLHRLPLPCHHEIISMHHSLRGTITVAGQAMCFDGGTGYIEKDRGSSFPRSYFWVQCNDFPGPPRAITCAVADLPMFGAPVRGCFCIIHDRGKEHRIATYLGARVVLCNERKLILRQGNLCLEAELDPGIGQILLAPQNGYMIRAIEEHLACNAHFRLYDKGVLVLELQSEQVAYEYVE